MATTLVTGASTGIGRAAAVLLARAGHDVVATMRTPERAPQLQEMVKRESLPVTILPLDVDSDASVTKAIDDATRQCGPIEALVNNAGIGQLRAVEDESLADFRKTMETNYFGALRCIKALLPGMRERRRGSIINVASVAGRIAITPQAAYAASKFALEATTEILAQEVGQFGIGVALVEPGVIATPIFNKLRPEIESPYPGERRLNAMFAASLTAGQPSPDLVGEKIRELVEATPPLKLRNPVGPDSQPFLRWRASMTDEEWVAMAGIEDDEDWAAGIQRDFGLDVRPFLGQRPAGIVKD